MDLKDKTLKWVQTQGYPLEYYVTDAFRNAGFQTIQGFYVDGDKGGEPREIDVLAHVDLPVGKETVIRIESLVECKWSKDKPWVVFYGKRQPWASARITQQFASKAGQAMLWVNAGNKKIQGLDLFSVLEKSGFGGRQVVFKKEDSEDNKDLFYKIVSAVTIKSVKLRDFYNKAENFIKNEFPFVAIVFPVIVIDGPLFAMHCDDSGELALNQVQYAKLHWSGSSSWTGHAAIEIVTKEYANEFARNRCDQFVKLAKALRPAFFNLKDCWEKKSLEGLRTKSGSTGLLGMPELLRDIEMRRLKANAARLKVKNNASDAH
ncbi:MAG: hypothetical protein R6X19_00135 [Kiritimatiellia bacterium]